MPHQVPVQKVKPEEGHESDWTEYGHVRQSLGIEISRSKDSYDTPKTLGIGLR